MIKIKHLNMKRLTLILMTLVLTGSSFAQLDTTKSNNIVSDIMFASDTELSDLFDQDFKLKLSVNSCLEGSMTDVTRFQDPLEIVKKLKGVIKDNVGSNPTLHKTWTVDFEYWQDYPLVTIFILEDKYGNRVEVNVMTTNDYKIRSVTIYSKNCPRIYVI